MIRCLDKDKLFPATNPVLCEEKTLDPFYEIKCCNSDNCNKFIRFVIPKRGETNSHPKQFSPKDRSHFIYFSIQYLYIKFIIVYILYVPILNILFA